MATKAKRKSLRKAKRTSISTTRKSARKAIRTSRSTERAAKRVKRGEGRISRIEKREALRKSKASIKGKNKSPGLTATEIRKKRAKRKILKNTPKKPYKRTGKLTSL